MNDDVQYQIAMNNDAIHNLNCRRTIYDNFMYFLSTFRKYLGSIQQNFNNASTAFSKGGYIYDGVTLDNGTLAQMSEKIQNDINICDQTLSNVSEELSRIDNEINNLQRTNQSLMS